MSMLGFTVLEMDEKLRKGKTLRFHFPDWGGDHWQEDESGGSFEFFQAWMEKLRNL